jgi:hypothetical protein
MKWVPEWMTHGLTGFVGFLPSLFGGLLILLIGYVVAKLLRRVTRSLLHRFGFDRLTQRLGVADQADPDAGSRWAGTAVFAVVIIATLAQAAVAWKLSFVAVGLAAVLAYLPHVLGAIVIFGGALLVGNWVRDRILGSATRPLRAVAPGTSFGEHRIVASAVRAGILALGGFMALRELQISAEIVTIAFSLVPERSRSPPPWRSGSEAATSPDTSPGSGTTSARAATGPTFATSTARMSASLTRT